MSNILILGANSDIAYACAHVFAQEGHNLVLASRNTSRLKEFQSEAHAKFSGSVDVIDFEATHYEDHQRFYDSIPLKIDCAIIAFGVYEPQENAMNDFEVSRRMMEVNYLGAVSISNILANDFTKRGQGCIIGISSVAGERGRAKNFVYGSTKSGFTTYLSGLRNSVLEHNVHVCTVIPGFVRTKMTEGMDLPDKLTASPEEVANVIYKKGFKARRNVIYVRSIWRLIMLIIKVIPEPIFKRLKIG